ncbi:MAG: outer membrane beta-barrel protein [Gammaproteobacteria bacterium]|jgi:OOP family OmpA-OmpF porin
MKRLISTLIALIAIAVTPIAYSEGYIGLGVGQSSVDIDAPGADSVDDKDTSFKIFGGLVINPNVKLEFTYMDLGEASVESEVFDFFIPVSNKISLKSKALSAAVVGQANISDNFSIFGKFGIARWDAKLTDEYRALVPVDPQSISASGSDSGFSPTIGVGMEVKLSQNLSLRAEWERYKDVADGLTYTDALGDMYKVDGNDVDYIGAGVYFYF